MTEGFPYTSAVRCPEGQLIRDFILSTPLYTWRKQAGAQRFANYLLLILLNVKIDRCLKRQAIKHFRPFFQFTHDKGLFRVLIHNLSKGDNNFKINILFTRPLSLADVRILASA